MIWRGTTSATTGVDVRGKQRPVKIWENRILKLVQVEKSDNIIGLWKECRVQYL